MTMHEIETGSKIPSRMTKSKITSGRHAELVTSDQGTSFHQPAPRRAQETLTDWRVKLGSQSTCHMDRCKRSRQVHRERSQCPHTESIHHASGDRCVKQSGMSIKQTRKTIILRSREEAASHAKGLDESRIMNKGPSDLSSGRSSSNPRKTAPCRNTLLSPSPASLSLSLPLSPARQLPAPAFHSLLPPPLALPPSLSFLSLAHSLLLKKQESVMCWGIKTDCKSLEVLTGKEGQPHKKNTNMWLRAKLIETGTSIKQILHQCRIRQQYVPHITVTVSTVIQEPPCPPTFSFLDTELACYQGIPRLNSSSFMHWFHLVSGSHSLSPYLTSCSVHSLSLPRCVWVGDCVRACNIIDKFIDWSVCQVGLIKLYID